MADYVINGKEYYRLYFKCPVCLERGNEVAASFWTHASDGGDIFVGADAKYYCEECETNKHVMDWAYKCPGHSNSDDDYVGAGAPAIAEAIGTSIQLVKIAGLPWIREFLANLE